MNTTEGAFELAVIAGIYAATVFVIGLIRDLRWRFAGDTRPRYPSLMGTAILALALLVPIYWAFRAAQPEGEWQRFQHDLPVPMAPSDARNFIADSLPMLRSREQLAQALGYSGSDLEPEVVQRCLTVSLVTRPVGQPAGGEPAQGGGLFRVSVQLAQTSRASLAIQQRLPRMEAAFALLADIEQSLWMLSPSHPRDLKQAGVRQLERILGAAAASLHSDRLSTFYVWLRQRLGEVAMAETDADLRQDIQKVRTLIPDSPR